MIESWTDDNGYTARVRIFECSSLVDYECTLLAKFIGGSAGRFRIGAPALVFAQYSRPTRAVRPLRPLRKAVPACQTHSRDFRPGQYHERTST